MLSKKVLDILNNYDITIDKREFYRNEYFRELEFYSNLDEDVIITIWYDGTESSFIKSFQEYAKQFDADEHAEMWINARENVKGVPQSVRDLIDDAEAIKNFLMDVAEELQDYGLSCNEYKCTITVADGTQERTQDFYVEAKSFEKAVKQIEQDLNTDLS